jgi:hypothetical protein
MTWFLAVGRALLFATMVGKAARPSKKAEVTVVVEKPLGALVKPPSGTKYSCAKCKLHVKNATGGVADFVVTVEGFVVDKDCYATYYWAFRHVGSFAKVVEQCQADAAFNDLFDSAKKVYKSLMPPEWDQSSEVSDNTRMTLTVSKSLVGVPRADYQQAFDISPEQVGHRLETLKDIHDNSYKGVLIMDPQSPFSRYTYQRSLEVEAHKLKMTGPSQLFAEQPQEVFDATVKERELSSQFYAKFHTCSMTFDQMKAEAEAAKAVVDSNNAGDPPPGTASERLFTTRRHRPRIRDAMPRTSSVGPLGDAVEEEDDDDDDDMQSRISGSGTAAASGVQRTAPSASALMSSPGLGRESHAVSVGSARSTTRSRGVEQQKSIDTHIAGTPMDCVCHGRAPQIEI